MDEPWDQIGARLRQSREKAEMSVDDVVFRAKIPRSVVEALEAEDFSVFTSPTYAKSFLRQYSEFLGVDAEPWLNALEPAAYVSGEALHPMFSAGETASPMKRPGREPRRAESERGESTGGKWSAVWLMLLSAALVVAAVKGYQVFDAKFGGDARSKEEAAGKEERKKEETAVVPAAPSVPAAPAGTPATAPVETTQEPPPKPPRAVIVRE